jgi:DNA-binding NarL/FixJ family response regulator
MNPREALTMIRVLLVDDHRMFLGGLRSMIEGEADMEVVGEAQDGRAALGLCADLSPDVVVMDVTMPELNGMDAACQITKRSPRSRVIGLSTHSDPRFVDGMLKAGAAGYLSKAGAPSELMTAIRVVAKGQTYLSPTVTAAVVHGYLHGRAGGGDVAFPSLSSREREVLQLLVEGKKAREIAMLLQVGIATVETYRRRILSKLDLHNLADLIKYAIREGLTGVHQG